MNQNQRIHVDHINSRRTVICQSVFYLGDISSVKELIDKQRTVKGSFLFKVTLRYFSNGVLFPGV